MFDLNKIKIKPVVCKGFNPTATRQEIEELIQYLGHSLPANYETILSRYNGGDPEVGDFILNNQEYSFNYFFSLGNRRDSSLNIWWKINSFSKFIGPNTLPFGMSGIGELYFFKWVDGNAEVWILRYDELEEPEDDFVASSFDEFLSRLHEGK